MSFKLRGTEDVFGTLQSLTKDSYRVGNLGRYGYLIPCAELEQAIVHAMEEYQRLLEHCEHQSHKLRQWDEYNLEQNARIGLLRAEVADLKNEIRQYGEERCDVEEENLRESPEQLTNCNGIAAELREYIYAMDAVTDADTDVIEYLCDRRDLLYIADRMDERLAAEYIKLPTDAEGVPWRDGSWLTLDGDPWIRALRYDGKWALETNQGDLLDPDCLTHPKPDTFESIIRDAIAYGRDVQELRHDEGKLDELVARCREVGR